MAMQSTAKEEDCFTCIVRQIPPESEALMLHQLGNLVTFVFSWKEPASWSMRNDSIFGSNPIKIPFLPTGQCVIRWTVSAKYKLYIPCRPSKSKTRLWSPEDYNKKNQGAFPGFVVSPVFHGFGSHIEILADLVNKLWNSNPIPPTASLQQTIPVPQIETIVHPTVEAFTASEKLHLYWELKGLKEFLHSIDVEQIDVTNRVGRLEEWARSLKNADERFNTCIQSVSSLSQCHQKVTARLNMITTDLKRLYEIHANHVTHNENVTTEMMAIQRNVSKTQDDIVNLKKSLAFNYFDLRSQINELKMRIKKQFNPTDDQD